MRKLLIGCGALALLLFCLVVGVGIFITVKVKGYTDSLAQVKTAYQATNQAYPFTPPDPPEMDEGRFKKYLAVRAALATTLEGEIDAIHQMEDAMKSDKGFKPGTFFSTMKTMAGLPKRLGTAHIAALEEQGMSVDEYVWHSKIVVGTIVKAGKEGEEVAATLSETYAAFVNQGGVGAVSPDDGEKPASIEAALGVQDVPLLPENLKLINDAKDDLTKYPQLLSVDLILREMKLGATSLQAESTSTREP